MEDLGHAAEKVAGLLQTVISHGSMRLRYRITMRSLKPKGTQAAEHSAETGARRDLSVEFSGPDTHLLTARNGELLHALEHVATKVLRLEPEEHDRVSFDADDYKANRDRQLRESAVMAVERVRATGRPYSFPSMTSRERRMLHLMLVDSGLPTASSGEGPGRFVVLYPEGASPGEHGGQSQPRQHDTQRVREAFRHR